MINEMILSCFCISRPVRRLMLYLALLHGFSSLPNTAMAHPMPNSVVLLAVQKDYINAEIQLPLSELQLSFGHAANDSSARLVAQFGPQLQAYLAQHIRPVSADGRAWTVMVTDLSVDSTQNPINGTYRELVAHCRLAPPAGADVRKFSFRYDVIVHQVVTHTILVSIQQDWERGILTDSTSADVGVIELDIPSGTVLPLTVNLAEGSKWSGFWAMLLLGIRHIAEGTDHLLFLLVLLLPAPLLVSGNYWGAFGGVRYSLGRLLRIVTAFTVGHSLTLLAGATSWVHLPSQPVEVLIAVSILVSAVHAIRPLFAGQEMFVAGGFGLVHGLAFASTLYNLQLAGTRLILSILGFNLGIEAIQLFIVALTMPGLILLSRSRFYTPFRIVGAILAGIAALFWVAERVSGLAIIPALTP
jgi:hypothetical protein